MIGCNDGAKKGGCKMYDEEGTGGNASRRIFLLDRLFPSCL